MRLIITKHAKVRIKGRLGLPKRAVRPMVEKVFDNGKRHGDFIGASKKYLSELYLRYRKANNMRVFNNHVFLFSNQMLLTVVPFPKEYQRYIFGKKKLKTKGIKR